MLGGNEEAVEISADVHKNERNYQPSVILMNNHVPHSGESRVDSEDTRWQNDDQIEW